MWWMGEYAKILSFIITVTIVSCRIKGITCREQWIFCFNIVDCVLSFFMFLLVLHYLLCLSIWHLLRAFHWDQPSAALHGRDCGHDQEIPQGPNKMAKWHLCLASLQQNAWFMWEPAKVLQQEDAVTFKQGCQATRPKRTENTHTKVFKK